MATICITTSLDLSDYLSKYGFGDGDDGAALELGFALRPEAVRILNEELQRVAFDLRAHPEDVGTIHNPCQVTLKRESGEDIWLEVEGDEVVGLDESLAAQKESLDAAWSLAYHRFEELVLGRSPLLSALVRCTRLACRIASGDAASAAEAGAIADHAEGVLLNLGVAVERTT